MKPMSLTSPESIAREYGGNKKAIADAARMGLIDPTAAVMAGMFIDRMRNAAAEEQKADTTVAQDVLGAPPPPQGIQQAMPQAAPQAAPQIPQMAQPQGIPGAQMAAAQPRMAPGVEGIPTGDVGNYAGGGIVAFADRGLVDENELEKYMEQLYPPSVEEIFARYQNNPEDLNSVLEEEAAKKQRIEEARNYNARINAEFFKNNPQFASPVDFRPVSPSVPVSNVNSAPSAKAAPNAEADKEKLRGKVRDTIGLPAIMKGQPDLTTPFNRASPEITANASQTRSILPPSVTARPEATPAPKVDAYGLPIPDPEANLALASKQAKSLVKIPTEESQADAIAATKNLYREMGVDSDLYKKQSEKLEEERRGLKADKEEAKWTRLIEAGFGVLAGTSPFASVNIGQGASPALKGFAQDIKDVKKADRELTRAQMALETTENQFKIDQSKSVQSRMEKNQDRVDKAQNTLATTTATLGNSLNALEGTKYEARLRDLSSRYGADQQLLGAMAYAGASRYGADRDTRAIERIMKEKKVDFTTALGLFYDQRQRDFDRFNSISNRVNQVNKDFNNSFYMQGKQNELRKLDPVKDKAKIEALNKEISNARREFQRQNSVTDADLLYLAQEPSRLSGQFGGGQPGGQPGGAGAFVVNTPQGPISFATKEQADAFRAQYNLP